MPAQVSNAANLLPIPNSIVAPTLAQGFGSQLTVTWTAPSVNTTHGPAATYNVRSSPSGVGTWTVVTGVVSPYTMTGLAPGAPYDVQIQCVNTSGASPWSGSGTLTTAGPFAPNPPGNVTLAAGTGSDLAVTWTAPATDAAHGVATSFNLQSSPSGANQWTLVNAVSSPYTLTGLTGGAAYDVQVESVDAVGASAWSATTTMTTAGPFAPNQPGTVTLAQGVGSYLTATWSAVAVDHLHGAATGYNLRSSPTGANTWTTVSGVTSPCTVTGLLPAAAYDVQVESVNTAGTSPWSAISTLTTGGPFAPNVPSVSLAQGAGSNLTVTWPAAASDNTHGAATGYSLRFSPSGANSWTTVASATSPYTVTGLSPATAYDVQVESVNAVGNSAWSAISTLTTAGPFAPNVPTGLSLAQGTSSNLTVTWTAPSADNAHGAPTGYSVRSSPSGANTWTVVSSATSPYTLTGLNGVAAYDVQVAATNAVGTSAWSAISTLTTGPVGTYAPNVPAITSVVPPADGTNSKLVVTWTAPTPDATHGAATGYNLRTSPSGANNWTTVTGVTSPYTVTGLSGAAAIDVEVQATNAAASPSAWSAITTATTWGVTVTPGNWTAAASQVHNTGVAPNGGVQVYASPAPTAVTALSFGWSASNTVMPTSGLITAGADGQTNGWGQWFNAPATAGTWYLWSLAQGSGGVTIGALVTSAITVT